MVLTFCYSTTISTLFFLLLLHFPHLSAIQLRRLLHHPFFPPSSPSLSLSPTQPPSSSPSTFYPPQSQPKHPFSTSISSPPATPSTSDFSGENPFFPSYPSSPPPPLPPSTTAVPTFPANISSLALPSSTSPPSHSPVSSKLLIVLVLLSFLTLSLIVSLTLFLHRRNSKSLRRFPSQTPLSPPPSLPPKLATTTHNHVSHTSSEFLYIGNALTDSRDFQTSSAIDVPSTSSEIYFKLYGDSPELRPLPPLPKKNSRVSFEQVEQQHQQTQLKPDEEEFFSPTSLSRKVFFEDDNFNNYGLNSSPARSYSDFPASDSDVSVEIQTLAARTHHFPATGKVGPPPPPPPPPPLGMGPPPLVPPSGPVVFKSSGNLGEKKSGERKEESMKPKLKAMHWEKVRASSDQVMVWDHLKPGSLQ